LDNAEHRQERSYCHYKADCGEATFVPTSFHRSMKEPALCLLNVLRDSLAEEKAEERSRQK
jgi:hypothetical protein